MKKFILLAFLFATQCLSLQSQALIFSFDTGLDGWTSDRISNDGFWQWQANGMADKGTYWRNRPAIQSPSADSAIAGLPIGAAVFDSDALISSGVIDVTTLPPVPSLTGLRSPLLDFTNFSAVYLTFYQYYRNFESTTRIEISLDGGQTWDSTAVNESVSKDFETSPADVRVLDISQVAGLNNVLVRFVFEGQYYFWIIDDIEFTDVDITPKTDPTYFADSLETFGYPFEIDSSNWAYIPNQVVIQFKTGTPDLLKTAIRDSVGAIKLESCACDRLELWQFGNVSGSGGNSPSPGGGGTTSIDENIKSLSKKAAVDGVDYNRYNYNELQDTTSVTNLPLADLPAGLSRAPANAIRIAILDTGVDIFHDSLKDIIFISNDLPGDTLDNDGNCLLNDFVGWNYVDSTNNPNDDHGHGTHVAGIIRQTLAPYIGCGPFRIIPYKTHDFRGVSNLFDVVCGTYQACIDSATVINDSWGFYGDSSIILRNAIDTARFVYGAVVITASGNDTTNMAVRPQYPACYTAANVITVGSLGRAGICGDTPFHSEFSNFEPRFVDVLAPGENIRSILPGNQTGFKTGTSMAAPMVTAATALAYCNGALDPEEAKDIVLNCATKDASEFGSQVLDGNVLNLVCIAGSPGPQATNTFIAYPNPVCNVVNVANSTDLNNVILNLFNAEGRSVFTKEIPQWDGQNIQQISLEHLPKGIYFLKVIENGNIWGYKLIKI
ncbi:S8 family peptidase [bacterium]|nr:S8 family peptidase [bacterium]